jgi:WxL domain surface cell wall-binding
MFRPIRLAQAIVLAGVAALIAVPAVLADTAPATASVTGGSLTETTASTPSVSVTLNGTDQVPTYTMAIATKDQTGSGSGWNLTITSTTFSTGGGSPQTLSNTASEVKGVTSACARGTCTNPTNSVSYPLTLPAGSAIPATPVKLFNAAVGTGLGDFTVTPTVGVTIPANAYAGTYTSTITLAVASAP